jgi:hypothetical protein
VGFKVGNPTDDQTKPVKVRQVKKKIGGYSQGMVGWGGGLKAWGKNFVKDFHKIKA